MVQKGAQDKIEQEQVKKGQGPFQHTRKEAVSMAAKQMASNNPNLYKVSLIFKSLRSQAFPCTTWTGIICHNMIDKGCVVGKEQPYFISSQMVYVKSTLCDDELTHFSHECHMAA